MEKVVSLQQLIEKNPFVNGCPLYVQLADLIERGIHRKVFTSGFIPPERELAKMLGISRVTVSKALSLLENKDLIDRQQGLGTRIMTHIGYSLNKRQGFTAQATRQGDVVSNQWLLRDRRSIDQRMANYLELPVGTTVAYLKRVRLANGCPVSIESTHIPLKFLPDPENLDGSLYDYWEKHNFVMAKKSFRLKAIVSDYEMSILLNVDEGVPILRSIEVTRNELDEVMEMSECHVLGDYYEFIFDS